MLAVRVAQLGQGERIAFPSDDGFEDGHPRDARQVTHDLGEFEIHLLQGFMHMLNMVRSVGEEHLAVTQIAAEHTDLISGAESCREQTIGVEALEPLAVEPIGFRAPRSALGLPGVDQEDLETACLQELEQGNPVDAGRFHGDGTHATVNEPVGEGVEVDGEGAETAHGLRVAPRGHGHPVLGFADVDAGGMGVADVEGVGKHG